MGKSRRKNKNQTDVEAQAQIEVTAEIAEATLAAAIQEPVETPEAVEVGDPEAEALAEANPETETPFDESKLLELASQEGLIEGLNDDGSEIASDEPEVDPATPLDLPEEEQKQLTASIETILFMSDRPISLARLRQIINREVKLSVYRVLMARLRAEFNADHRGVEIAEVSMGFQLRTKPHMANVLRRMVKTTPLKLSPATLEVLAITAYKQPLTKEEVDQIRGVDSGYVLRNLMEKRLVKIVGRSELPGRPMLYATTHEFLELFSLKDLASLPPLHEVEQMVAASEIGVEERSVEAFEEFGKMVANSTKILFDDSQIDTELESLRSEIASVKTSTDYLDYQRAKEKFDARVAELASRGMMLDVLGNEVPIGTAEAMTFGEYRPWIEVTTEIAAEAETVAEAPAELEAATEIESTAETEVVTEADTVAESGELAETPVVEHAPSPELVAAAEQAQWERHAEILAQASAQAEVSLVNAESSLSQITEEVVGPEASPKPEELKGEELQELELNE